jgi:DNA-binding response OmpR family regulator
MPQSTSCKRQKPPCAEFEQPLSSGLLSLGKIRRYSGYMSSQKIRLDEILVSEGLITEAQVKEALEFQKAHGGKFGSQLLYHRFIDEVGLVKALAIQQGCEGVVLSNVNIVREVLKFIPAKIAIARKVVPFDYNPETNILKVACEDPYDENLLAEVQFVSRGKEIKLYVAADMALTTAITRYYQTLETTQSETSADTIPDVVFDTDRIVLSKLIEPRNPALLSRGKILLVTDDEFSSLILKSILEHDEFSVTTTDSADDAIEKLSGDKFQAVFIKDTVSGDYIDLIDRLRKLSPKTTVRYFESASALLLHEDAIKQEKELLTRNLEVFTSLLASNYKLASNHSAIVGQYVDQVCRRMGLPEKDALVITNAAYLHDLARYYYHTNGRLDCRAVAGLTVKLLESLNYSPVVIEILRSMYINLGGKYTKRLPIEVLGGNIITAVDLFCESVVSEQRLSLDKFDVIRRKLRDLVGKLFLPEVIDVLVGLIQEEILAVQTSEQVGQVMLYADSPDLLESVEHRLRKDGFRVFSQTDMIQFIDLFRRSKPDMLVLTLSSVPAEIVAFVDKLIGEGISLEETPTFVLAGTSDTSQLTTLFEKGIEDILSNDGNLDFLVIKMKKIQARLEEQARQRGEAPAPATGARGRLMDMNLIDLLQALGPSRKTAKITVTSSTGGELTLYLHHGVVEYAEQGGLSGADAVYDALGWSSGSWQVEPIDEQSLPKPNNTMTNESLLIEGCRLLDEKQRV